MLTQMHVKGLIFDPPGNYIMILRGEEDGQDVLPIWIGKTEARAISLVLEQIDPPRPMTHDLIKAALDACDAKMISSVITELRENTYFAKIHMSCGDAEITVDARPSDAIALALRTESPIFVSGPVLQRKPADEDLTKWLETLKPEDFDKGDG